MTERSKEDLFDLAGYVSKILSANMDPSYRFFLMVFPESGVVEPTDGCVSSNADREVAIEAMKVFITACEKESA